MTLPNIRKLFIPDPGYLIVDADLKGADAQVVAWEAGDEDLKDAFRRGENIHFKNGNDFWGEGVVCDAQGNKCQPFYNQIKRSVHAANYGASANAIAAANGWSLTQAGAFLQRWFELHPAIAGWHRRIESELVQGRKIRNAFGFHRIYLDRVDGILPEALAWIPQSTIGINCDKGARQIERAFPFVEFLLQAHDSLVFQIPLSERDALPEIHAALTVTIPYPDPLRIQWSIATSEQSWGHCKAA